jgi:hypothetical protein
MEQALTQVLGLLVPLVEACGALIIVLEVLLALEYELRTLAADERTS